MGSLLHVKWIMGIMIPNASGEIWTLWVCYCLAERAQMREYGTHYVL